MVKKKFIKIIFNILLSHSNQLSNQTLLDFYNFYQKIINSVGNTKFNDSSTDRSHAAIDEELE